jgi:beta-lactamase regulating signal transducer with metallopeptidase domain
MDFAGHPATGWISDGDGHALGMAGIFAPRIMLRKDVLAALSPEQLDAALRHEWAHAESRDNLKKLLLFLLPDVFPFAQSRLQELNRGWARFAEWAADDRATGGDPQSSLWLADALIRVARLGIPAAGPPLTTSLIADRAELAARVTRLLEPMHTPERDFPKNRRLNSGLAIVILAAAIVLGPPALSGVHELLELLVR